MKSDEYRKAIGAKVRIARRARGISVERFALVVGIDRNYLRDIEYGRANPTVDVMAKISDGLETPVWELMNPTKDSRS